MVRGLAMAVTAVTDVSQCAEMARMALGLAKPAANLAHMRLVSLSWMATMGLPWPTKAAGMAWALVMDLYSAASAGASAPPPDRAQARR